MWAVEAQVTVTLRVTRRDQRVVSSGAGVAEYDEHRLALLVDEDVTDSRADSPNCQAGVRHGQRRSAVGEGDRPGICDLVAQGVDDVDASACRDSGGLPSTAVHRDLADWSRRHEARSLPLS